MRFKRLFELAMKIYCLCIKVAQNSNTSKLELSYASEIEIHF